MSESRAYYRPSYRRFHAKARNKPKTCGFVSDRTFFGFSAILWVLRRLSARYVFSKTAEKRSFLGEIAQESHARKNTPNASRATEIVRGERITDKAANHVIFSVKSRDFCAMRKNSADFTVKSAHGKNVRTVIVL